MEDVASDQEEEEEDQTGDEAAGSPLVPRDTALEPYDDDAEGREKARMAREAKELAEEEECQRRWYVSAGVLFGGGGRHNGLTVVQAASRM